MTEPRSMSLLSLLALRPAWSTPAWRCLCLSSFCVVLGRLLPAACCCTEDEIHAGEDTITEGGEDEAAPYPSAGVF